MTKTKVEISSADLPVERVLNWAARRPDQVFLTQPLAGGKLDEFSWARVADEARRMAAHLRSLDFPPKSQIAILSKNCAHFFIADLAIWMAGHVSVAIYPTLSGSAVRYILDHSESKLLFVGKLDAWDEQKASIPPEIPCIAFSLAPPTQCRRWADVIASTAPLQGDVTRAPDELAVIMYTSGSTGAPKGVMHSFRTMTTSAKGFALQYDIRESDRMLSYLPLAHVFERACVETVGLLTGMHVFFAESLDTFVEDVKRARPTLFISVPRLWAKFQQGVFTKLPPQRLERLLKIPVVSSVVRKKILTGLGLDEARVAGSGSAPLPEDVLRWYQRIGLNLVEGYGLSENFSYSHQTIAGQARVGYVGTPAPGVEVRISSEGEIQVKSPATMLGYFKNPEGTAAAFTPDGFLRTGDRGEIDERHRLRLTGRVKELFKTAKGKYVAPAPIENLINGDRHVELSCVAGHGEASPHAVVMLKEEISNALADSEMRKSVEEALTGLLERVNATLEEHEKLAFVAVATNRWTIENGLLTPTMKIRRGAIEATYARQVPQWYAAKRLVVWQ
jgi:long-chain acyl-CoA synthetase